MRQDPRSMAVAVAIVNYGTAEMVIDALPSLRNALDEQSRSVVFIVDNASPDGDAARLAEHFAKLGPDPMIRLIASPRNGGFAAGNNVAFEAIRKMDWAPDAVLMLNPDAELRPGALQEMLKVLAERPKAGFAGPRLERADGLTWNAAFRFPSLMGEFARETGLSIFVEKWPILIDETKEPVRAGWITGAAMLARWEMIEQLGGMDDRYFLYFEEVDFMLAATQAGWEVWHVPAAVVRHVAGGATGFLDGKPRQGPMPDYWFESWTRYFEKNHGSMYARTTALAKLAGMFIGDFKRWAQRRPRARPPRFARTFMIRCLLRSGVSSPVREAVR